MGSFIGMAVQSPKSSKMTTRNKNKFKHRKHSMSKVKRPTTTSTPPISTSKPAPIPTPSVDVTSYPMLKIVGPETETTVVEQKRTPKIIDFRKYYPLKSKRLSPKTKTVLKNQFSLKNIKCKNKRKSTVPRKGQVDYEDPDRVEFTELTMFEIIRFFDETDILDDETINEIMDCPSPVWWEDAPDDDYCEDPIDRELVREALEGIRESPPPIEEDVQVRVQLLKKQLKINEKFIQKNNKLENILGNLKNRIKVEDAKRDEIVNNDAKNDENIGNDHQYDAADMKRDTASNSRHSESSDSDILSDISVNEDELLKNLETIEIPIKHTPMTETVRNIIKPKSIIVPKTLPTLLKFPYQSANIEFSRLKTLTESLRAKSSTVTSTSNISQTSTSNFVDLSKSKSYESSKLSFSDDTISGEIDSISDTNVRFLDDDDVEMLTCRDIGNFEINDNVIDETVIITDYQEGTVTIDEVGGVNRFDEVVCKESLETGSYPEESELVTVYSIVESEPETKEPETKKPEVKKVRKYKTNIECRDSKMIALLKT